MSDMAQKRGLGEALAACTAEFKLHGAMLDKKGRVISKNLRYNLWHDTYELIREECQTDTSGNAASETSCFTE